MWYIAVYLVEHDVFVSGPGGQKLKIWAIEIGHSVANGLQPLWPMTFL